MKKLLFTILALFSFAFAQAEDESAVYVWAEGSGTCYKLESMPKVTINGNKALLTLSGETVPVLTLEITGQSSIKTVFGVYKKQTAIETVEAGEDSGNDVTPVRQNGKFISGGRLIIVKKGKQYDINGIEIK